MNQQLNIRALGQDVLNREIAERPQKRKGHGILEMPHYAGSCSFMQNGIGTCQSVWHVADTARHIDVPQMF